MSFIIFDLEFNQDVSSLQVISTLKPRYPFEIIQIGAIKLDSEFNTTGTFDRFVRPTFYAKINSYVTELTGISTEQLQGESPFPNIYKEFIEFIGDPDSIFCTWGMSDIKELFKNVEAHQLSDRFLPKKVINLQPYVSRYLELSEKKQFRLQHAAENLSIPITYPFHNALYDAYYTAEIFRKIYNSSVQPKFYDPTYIPIRRRQVKKVIDTDKLLGQFEKMYARKMTDEEKEMIELAYKMGRSNQFLKEISSNVD